MPDPGCDLPRSEAGDGSTARARLAEVYEQILALEAAGAGRAELTEALDVAAEAVDPLVEIAHRKARAAGRLVPSPPARDESRGTHDRGAGVRSTVDATQPEDPR